MNISHEVTEYEEYKILSSYLANPNETEAALQHLTECATSSHSIDDLEAHLGRSWNSILYLSTQHPHSSEQQDSLVKLLQALTTAHSLKDTNGKEIEIDGSKVWQGLPFFGQAARACWNFPSDKDVDKKTRDMWISVNAFVARMTAAAVNAHGGERQDYGALDYSLYGLWSLRSALEEERENSPGKTTIDASVGAAAAWILYAGPTLRGLSDSNKTYSGKVAKPGSKSKDQEWRGYNNDRWQLWKEELGQAKSLVQDDSIQHLVQQALEVMN